MTLSLDFTPPALEISACRVDPRLHLLVHLASKAALRSQPPRPAPLLVIPLASPTRKAAASNRSQPVTFFTHLRVPRPSLPPLVLNLCTQHGVIWSVRTYLTPCLPISQLSSCNLHTASRPQPVVWRRVKPQRYWHLPNTFPPPPPSLVPDSSHRIAEARKHSHLTFIASTPRTTRTKRRQLPTCLAKTNHTARHAQV